MEYPFGRTWWIDPGKILGGRYPGTLDAEESKQMLGKLLDFGVRTIINLQQANEPGQGGNPFADYTPTVAALAKARGVSVKCHRVPVPDCGVPSVQQMRQILGLLQESVAAGRLVYVHCWGGHGRTATVAGCWMVQQGVAAEQVFALIRERRQHDARLDGEIAPQTAPQRKFISDWPAHVEAVPWPAPEDRSDRLRGALLGLAVGDALGTSIEFQPPGSFTPLKDIVGGGPFGLKPGQWTDDTSMALCLAESLAERRCFDPVDQLQRYVRWWKEGHLSSTGRCFDIGNQTRSALEEHQNTGRPFCGPTSPHNAGNGSLMRLSPVAIACHRSPLKAIVYAGESSRTTHGNRECVDACRYFAGLLAGAIQGVDKQTLLGDRFCPIPGLWEHEPLSGKIDAVARGSFHHKQPPEIRGGGYVVHCLEAALWAVASTDSFEQAVLAAVNLGDDADTTGAVCGQLAGALYGASTIPQHWLEKLAMRELIEQMAGDLIGFADVDGGVAESM